MWTVLQIYMFSLADAFEASFILKKVFAYIYRLVILWNEDVCANWKSWFRSALKCSCHGKYFLCLLCKRLWSLWWRYLAHFDPLWKVTNTWEICMLSTLPSWPDVSVIPLCLVYRIAFSWTEELNGVLWVSGTSVITFFSLPFLF